MLHGTWSVKGNTACTDWKEVPNNPAAGTTSRGDTITQINVATTNLAAKSARPPLEMLRSWRPRLSLSRRTLKKAAEVAAFVVAYRIEVAVVGTERCRWCVRP